MTTEYTQIDFLTMVTASLWVEERAVYYYESGKPENHRFYCGDQDCEYCFAIGSMLTQSDYHLDMLISYEQFIELFPDADSEYSWVELLKSYYVSSSVSSSVSHISYDNYDDTDVDDYTYGYNPSEIDSSKDATKLNYNRLEIVGAGCSGVVLSDGVFAVKIGSVEEDQYHRMITGAREGFCVPVYEYKRWAKIDDRIVTILQESEINCNGWSTDFSQYINRGNDGYYADMLVMAVAEPLVSTDISQDSEEFQHATNVADRVRQVYREKTGKYWRDSHGYNIGLYNGCVVILDI